MSPEIAIVIAVILTGLCWALFRPGKLKHKRKGLGLPVEPAEDVEDAPTPATEPGEHDGLR